MTVEVSKLSTTPTFTTTEASELLEQLRVNVESVFRGKPQVVRWTLASVLARGHVLLEDVPGVGKTTLALAMARSLGLSFQRIQFTSDLLPGDILGVSIYSAKTGEFQFLSGPIFHGLVLADEINRTTPRTQSALLEAMSEGSVSVDNQTLPLPNPFLVIATQNPLDNHGTYPLPESQLDRFMFRLSIGYPAHEIERAILLERKGADPVHSLDTLLQEGDLLGLQKVVSTITVDESIADYILKVVAATREHPQVRVGISTRGALAVMRALRAIALIEGRDFAIPDDAREVLIPCLAHRLSLRSGNQDRGAAEAVMESIVAEIDAPR